MEPTAADWDALLADREQDDQVSDVDSDYIRHQYDPPRQLDDDERYQMALAQEAAADAEDAEAEGRARSYYMEQSRERMLVDDHLHTEALHNGDRTCTLLVVSMSYINMAVEYNDAGDNNDVTVSARFYGTLRV
jgi:hypothetical protein